ncbi:MAG: DUF1993 domain-containing protein [Azoarcus sp.]|jgi:hypothetical protein|nr:DUF1993 domain-containing protein [Azoarcus sp.]
MSISYHQLAVTGYLRALDNLDHLLDKAIEHVQARKLDERALLDARLFPDMFPLSRQIQMVSVMTANGVAWLIGKETPQFENTETTFAALKRLLAQTAEFLKSVKESDFADSANREVRLPWKPNEPLRGEVFLLQHSIPNVYFHLTTAYDIMRHNGVEIGKADYLGKIAG